MRRVNWEEHAREVGRKAREATPYPWQKERTAARVRRRPRDQVELEALRHLDRARWERALAEGRLERLGPRRYRLHERHEQG